MKNRRCKKTSQCQGDNLGRYVRLPSGECQSIIAQACYGYVANCPECISQIRFDVKANKGLSAPGAFKVGLLDKPFQAAVVPKTFQRASKTDSRILGGKVKWSWEKNMHPKAGYSPQDLVPNPARDAACDPPRFVSKWTDKKNPHRGWDWSHVKDVPYGVHAGPLFLRSLDARYRAEWAFGDKNVLTLKQYGAGARIPSTRASEKQINSYGLAPKGLLARVTPNLYDGRRDAKREIRIEYFEFMSEVTCTKAAEGRKKCEQEKMCTKPQSVKNFEHCADQEWHESQCAQY